jgi:hypothetical protein
MDPEVAARVQAEIILPEVLRKRIADDEHSRPVTTGFDQVAAAFEMRVHRRDLERYRRVGRQIDPGVLVDGHRRHGEQSRQVSTRRRLEPAQDAARIDHPLAPAERLHHRVVGDQSAELVPMRVRAPVYRPNRIGGEEGRAKIDRRDAALRQRRHHGVVFRNRGLVGRPGRQARAQDRRAVGRDRDQELRVRGPQPRLQLRRAVGERRDFRRAHEKAGRLLDGAVAVEKQLLLVADDDARVARQKDRVAHHALQAHQFVAQPEVVGEKTVGLARPCAPGGERLRQGRRRTENSRLSLGHDLRRLRHLDQHRHRQQTDDEYDPWAPVACEQAHCQNLK